jgi:hypothetical protein
MKRYLFSLALALIIILSMTTNVLAQDYYFSLDKETVHVYWNADGTLALDYTFLFTNQPSGHAIEYVDIGIPKGSLDLSTASADVNGNPINLSESDYQGTGTGFAVVMGPYAIPPGQTGSVHVYMGQITGVLYKDDEDPNYTSAVFSPVWFDSQYVTGSTDLTVIFHLPPGVKPEEPRYHPSQNWPGSQEPQASLDSSGRIIYSWSSTDANGYTQYTFGTSFPVTYIPAETIVQPPAFNFDFGSLFDNLFPLLCCGFLGFLFVGLPILGVISDRKRKMQYMPPRIAIEGHGIKRGLTAVEAGVLMQEPLDKVMTMILFGTLKKGATQVISREPLKLQSSDPLPENLLSYEREFLASFKESELGQQRKGLQDMMVQLIRSVTDKMKGFSRKETIDYYKGIMERAWQQIETADTPEVKSQMFDEALEWTMLDKKYDDRTRDVFHSGPVFVPMWWGRYDPSYGRTATTPTVSTSFPGTSTAGRGSTPSVPHLPGSDFAASVVTGVQTFSSKVIGDVTGFTKKITNVTNPPPKPSTSSYRGGGGGHSSGCACACACAGCACACAGGGR